MLSTVKSIFSVRSTARILVLYLIFSFLFYAYRYPLSYNDEGTSGTYSATPLAFQIAKYAFTVLFAFFFTVSFFGHKALSEKKTFPNLPIFAMGFFLLLYIFKLSFALEGPISAGVKTLFFFPIILIASASNISFESAYLKKLFLFFLVISLIADAVQIGLYLGIHRLPALAYLDGKFVRFGGVWDDPNAFACFLMLPLGILLSDQQNRSLKRYVLIAACVGMLILTLSLTGLIMLIVLLSLDSILKKRHYVVILLLGFFALWLSFVNFDFLKNLIADFILSKEGSISEHANYASVLERYSLSHIPFGNPTDFYIPESYYIGFFVNFGIIAFLALWAIQISFLVRVYAFYKLSKRTGMYEDAVFFRGAFLFLLCFFAGNMFIPYYTIYPINFIFWFLFVVCWNKMYSAPRFGASPSTSFTERPQLST